MADGHAMAISIFRDFLACYQPQQGRLREQIFWALASLSFTQALAKGMGLNWLLHSWPGLASPPGIESSAMEVCGWAKASAPNEYLDATCALSRIAASLVVPRPYLG